MITPAYCRTMAAYNSEMNRRLYAAAGRLTRTERRQERGAFWGSIHGTLNHLLWGDSVWLSRFDGGPAPAMGLKASATFLPDFAAMQAARAPLDARIESWAAALAPPWLDGDLSWFSGAVGRDMTKPRGLLVMHFFNHQTHHRGQAHAMLTAAGQDTGATDLPFVLP